jgi:hypothetical protein
MVEQQRVLKQNADAPPLGRQRIAAPFVEPQFASARKSPDSAPIIQANSVDFPLPEGPSASAPGYRKGDLPQQRLASHAQGQMVYG